MRRTKPDRWERLVDKHTEYTDCGIVGLLGKKEVVQLLRREHRATLRIIKNNTLLSTDKKFDEGWNHCLDDLLFILRKRAQ